MSRGGTIPSSLPITLKNVAMGLTYSAANVLRTDTFSTGGATGSVTAPAGACAVKIEVWGAGGGGRGTYIGTEYGGGGGGYGSIIVPANNNTTFSYSIGSGGIGGTSANGASGGSTSVTDATYLHDLLDDFVAGVRAFGGGGGTTLSTGGQGATVTETLILPEYTSNTSGTDGTSSAGGTGGNGGAGGGTLGGNGTAPGGGGGPNTSGKGGDGAAGQAVFTWYGANSVWNLRSFLRGGSYNTNQGAVGANGLIPTSGTIKLSDFLALDGIGFYANNYPTGLTNWRWYAYGWDGDGGVAFANAWVRLSTTGRVEGASSASIEYNTQNWLQRMGSNADSTLTSNFDAYFQQSTGSTLGTVNGASVNTWIQLSSSITWWIEAEQIGFGTQTEYRTGYLRIRRRSDNVELVNVAIRLQASCDVETGGGGGGCPFCCFTPDTLITMADYTTKRIVDVEIGEYILTVNGGSKQVTETIVRVNRPMHVIHFADGRTINASEDHPFHVVGKGAASINPHPTIPYKNLGIPATMTVGDLVIDQNGNENEIVQINPLYFPHEVYTFAETEFYANGMLVY